VRLGGQTLATIASAFQSDDNWRTVVLTYDCPGAGNQVLEFRGTRTGGEYASAIDRVQLTGASTFTVAFAPSAPGSRTATLSIASNDNDENPYDIILTGSGTGLTNLESWRQLHFGTTADAGNAANLFDFDQDDLVNIVEYAFGLNPKLGSSIQLPQVQISGGDLFYSFTEPAGLCCITYGAQWSTTLQANDWHDIADTGTAPQHIFSVPIAGQPKLFIRLLVNTP
jgi:hypothetical protein